MTDCELCGKMETPDGNFNGHADCYEELGRRDRNGICNRCNKDLPNDLPYSECPNCDENSPHLDYPGPQ